MEKETRASGDPINKTSTSEVGDLHDMMQNLITDVGALTGFPKECLQCRRTRLESAAAMKNHYRDKHKKHKELCEICGYCFINKAEFEQHKNSEHSTRRVHKLAKKNPKKKKN